MSSRRPVRSRVQLDGCTEGPPDRPAADRQFQAAGVNVGSASREARSGAVDGEVASSDEPKEPVLIVTASTADAGALGSHRTQAYGHIASNTPGTAQRPDRGRREG